MAATLTAYLVDEYLHTQTPIDLGAVTAVDFVIDATPASAAADRFKVVFRVAGTLPLTVSSIRAVLQGGNIAVGWQVQNENAISHYEVEKSADGTTFSKAATQKATRNSTGAVDYNWLDVNAATGSNYYRIRSLAQNGQSSYSPVVKVTMGEGKASYQVYPNPVSGSGLNLQFINQPKGTYSLRLLNTAGQVIISRRVVRQQGSSTESIDVTPLLPKGTYTLEITEPNGRKHSFNIVR